LRPKIFTMNEALKGSLSAQARTSSLLCYPVDNLINRGETGGTSER